MVVVGLLPWKEFMTTLLLLLFFFMLAVAATSSSQSFFGELSEGLNKQVRKTN
jgi:hypothetical protein